MTCEISWCNRTEPHDAAGEVHDGGSNSVDGVPVRMLQARSAAQPRIYVGNLPVQLDDAPELADLLKHLGQDALAALVIAASAAARGAA
jgi:hypothetical protein